LGVITSLGSRLCSKIPNQLIDQTARIRERQEVANRQLVDSLVKSFPRDTPVEVDRIEPIVAPGDHVDRHLGQRFEIAGLAESDVGVGTLVRLAWLDDSGGTSCRQYVARSKFVL
jgi:hypothetical protein